MKYELLIVLSVLVGFELHANTRVVNELNGSSIQFNYISYDYNIYYDGDNIDCTGDLNVTLKVPSGTNAVIFERSAPHLHCGDEARVFTKSFYDVGADLLLNVNIPQIKRVFTFNCG